MPSSTDTPKLHYFVGRGLGEKTRWMLAASEIEFDQVAMTTFEEFKQLRDDGKLLFNQLPLLEIDGLRLVQSKATYRYVANKGGLVAKDIVTQVNCDMIGDASMDLSGPTVGFPWQADPEAFKKDYKVLFHKKAPLLEAAIAAKLDPIDKRPLYYSDVLVADMLTSVRELLGNDFVDSAKYPNIVQICDHVCALPGVARYLASDKRFPFPEGEIGVAYKNNVSVVLGK